LHDLYFSKEIIGTRYDVFSYVGNNGSTTDIIVSEMPDHPKIMMYFAMWIGKLKIVPVIILVCDLDANLSGI
jgi:Trk-type K+ transport system membrane component